MEQLQKFIGKHFHLIDSKEKLFQLDKITTEKGKEVAHLYEMTPFGLAGDDFHIPCDEFYKAFSLAE